MTKREILLVCDSHRTGTSALTGVLRHLGWKLPKTLMPGSHWNPKGYFEAPAIRDFHDDVLEYLDRPVYDFRETAIDVDFKAMMQARAIQMSDLLQSEFGKATQICYQGSEALPAAASLAHLCRDGRPSVAGHSAHARPRRGRGFITPQKQFFSRGRVADLDAGDCAG